MSSVPERKQLSKRNKKEPSKLDLTHLESTLVNQLRADQKYQRENDVKIRAMTEGTVTYDDFRQRVLAAHIQPLDKEDRDVLVPKMTNCRVLWNTLAEKPSGSSRNEMGAVIKITPENDNGQVCKVEKAMGVRCKTASETRNDDILYH